MVHSFEEQDRTIFVCDECGLGYVDKATAQECENFCKNNESCSLAIARKAIYHPS